MVDKTTSFKKIPELRDMKYPTSSIAKKMEENSSSSEHVLRLSGYYNHLNQVGVNLPDKTMIGRVL